MKKAAVLLAIMLACVSSYSQRPSDPALLVPQQAPLLDYVPVENPLAIPAGMTIGSTANVAFDSKGHLFLLTRGTQPLIEFDAAGKFIRAFGQGLFTRTHGIRIERNGDIWVTDVGAHVVVKLNPQGQVILTLGTKGEPGEWNEATQYTVHRTQRCDHQLRRGHLYCTGTHRRWRRSARLEIRQEREVCEVLGGKGTAPGSFRLRMGWRWMPKVYSGLRTGRTRDSDF